MFALKRGVFRSGLLRPQNGSLVSGRLNNAVKTSIPLTISSIRFNSTDGSGESKTSQVLHNLENIINHEEREIESSLGFDEDLAAKQELLHNTTLTSDQWGYLKSVGLVDGWWPSDIIQQVLEAVHVFSGLPWWATIAVTTVAFRVMLFPLFMKSSDTMARSQAIMPETKKLRKEMTTAMSTGDRALQQRKQMELSLLNKKNGVKYSRMFLSPVTQMVYSVGSFFGIREMSNLPIEGLTTQGTLWFQDLAAADPYIGLQLISASLYSIAFKFGGDTGNAQFGGPMKKIFMILPFASIAFTWNMSAAVMVYFSANGLCSIVQSQLLRNATFRNKVGMFPLPTKAQLESNPQKGMFDNFNDTWKEMQQNNKVRAEREEEAMKGVELARKQATSNRVVVKSKKYKKN
ncbi:Mitochondrial inner membrane protein oxa1 [Pichia californica]|uniref:Mitochondrial inner membrane protein oxa1 n=1 Tax=Pichia californica TaxID=460514 RepID=A0A9P7BEC9_9ASCO|nr:Mitochondrial inner membrane protein oxa1 [[Candida] californica]KAG0689177.1 Mitochondrial inner membrane protein oxa1 [[Candida] californica]